MKGCRLAMLDQNQAAPHLVIETNDSAFLKAILFVEAELGLAAYAVVRFQSAIEQSVFFRPPSVGGAANPILENSDGPGHSPIRVERKRHVAGCQDVASIC